MFEIKNLTEDGLDVMALFLLRNEDLKTCDNSFRGDMKKMENFSTLSKKDRGTENGYKILFPQIIINIEKTPQRNVEKEKKTDYAPR